MKIRSLKCWLALLVFAFAMGLGLKQQAFGQNCLIGFTGPAGNVLTSFINVYPGYPNSDASFHTLVQDTNEPLPIGTYLSWCIDASTELDPSQNNTVPGTSYTGLLFPTCDTNLNNELPPGHSPTSYVSPTAWQQVNYILNHKSGFYFWDIQVAILSLVGGPPPANGAGYPPYTPANVQSLLDAANNNAATWIPQCGDVIGAIYVITNQAGITLTSPVQLVMLEIPYCQVTFTKCPTNLALGCNPASIPDVDTNSVSASSCCGNPVTITGSKSESTLNCTGYRLLTYTASDGYGNTATCSQTITWTIDTNAPVIVTVPTNTNLGCNPATLPTDASLTAQVTVADGCSSATLKVSHVDAGSSCGMTRTFTITATDGCGNTSAPKTVIYTWTVDLIKPIITSIPVSTNLGCNPTTVPTDASIKALVKATDDCTLQNTNVSHVDSTNLCSVTRTFTINASDACGNVSTNKIVVYTWTVDTTKPVITCPPDITISNSVVPYCTYTPGDYGSKCNGTNAASILTNCFKKVYPGGYVQCGLTNTSYWVKFTSCTNVQKFVLCGGTPGCLKANYSNPTNCEAGVFAGQALCLKLNVDLGDAKSLTGSAGCGDLVLNDSSSSLNGKSIRQILGICNTALGGGNVSSYGCTISNLNIVCSNLNQSFQGCKPSTWCQTHVTVPAITNVTPKVTGYATVIDKCSSTPVLTYTDVTSAGTCVGAYTIARTWVAVDGCGNSNYCTQTITVGVPKVNVCVTGPCKGISGQTGNYTCSVTNTGSTCFSAGTVTACGQSFTCPVLQLGQGCSFSFGYKFTSGDVGTFNCQATAACTYSTASKPCTASGSCSTTVAKK